MEYTPRQRELVERFVRLNGYDPTGLDDFTLKCLAAYIVIGA